MSTISNVKELALNLPVSDRASLASILLRSLPEVLSDEDGGVAEAHKRRDELNANPEIGISPEELRKRISERFEI
ncbi:MAG: addiction module protein [Acidobacteria bacterium]|nr:addiction module protein [Acidobacteriota bacterium]